MTQSKIQNFLIESLVILILLFSAVFIVVGGTHAIITLVKDTNCVKMEEK